MIEKTLIVSAEQFERLKKDPAWVPVRPGKKTTRLNRRQIGWLIAGPSPV